MALIVGFPDFAAKASLDDTDLNDALVKIVEQTGGSVGNGGEAVVGNLDLTNHIAAVGWRNAQKAEPRALVPIVFAGQGGVLDPLGDLPLELVVRGVTAVVSGVNKVNSLTLTFKMDGRSFLGVSTAEAAAQTNQAFTWEASGRIPAGVKLSVEAALELSGSGTYDAITVALWCAAEHVE